MTALSQVDESSRAAQIAALIGLLHETERALEALTAGEIDSGADRAARVVRQRSVGEPLRRHDAASQTALLNALPAHIAVLDADGLIVQVNQAWRRYAAENGLRDPGYGIGRSYLDVCKPAPGTQAALTRAVAAGVRAVLAGERSSFSIEYACDSPGEAQCLLMMATPLEAGHRAGAVVMHINVSARARAEQATQRSSVLLQAVADGTPDVVYVKDVAGCYLLCNQALADFTGRPIEQILGCDDLALFGPAETAPLVDRQGTLITDGGAASTEGWLTGVDGPRLFHTTRAPYRDDQGQVAGVVGIARDITADRRAQQALRDGKSMLDMVGRCAKVGGWTLELEQRQLKWSDRVAQLHDEPAGFSPSLERGLLTYAPEHRAAVREAVEACIAVGQSYDLEAEKVTASGRRFWVRTIGEAVHDGEGRIVRIQGALQDITERKLAALQTHRLARRLADTLESITDGFFTVDRDWHFTYINHQAERLWVQPRDALLGQVMWEAFPDVLGTGFEPLYRRAMSGEKGICYEALYRPMGKWFGADFHPLEDGLSVYFRDVTATRVAGQHLRLLEASVAQLNDIVIISEPAPDLRHGLRIVFVNDAFVRLTGYTRAEVSGLSPGLLDGPLTDVDELARMRHAVEHFAPVHVELVKYTKDGQQRPVEIDITPVSTNGDGYSHFVSVIRDISERRRSEEALKELNAGLEDRVRLRTIELERARELAELANRAKSSFLATMSHEIRTPMNGVIGMIDVLEESRLHPSQRSMVKTVRESAYALLAIVDDVLDFSKIEAGQFEIACEPIDVAAVVEGVCDALRPVAEGKRVGLHMYIDPRLPAHSLGDAGRLRQVLMNLVGNSIKFSSGQARPGLVSLRALRVGPVQPACEPASDQGDEAARECDGKGDGKGDGAGGERIALVVTDNGVGMDVGTLARLFSPFTQADASTTRRFGGTGLGLSISQRLVTMMGGDITVRSELHQGATFTVHLPLSATADEADKGPPSTVPQLVGLPCLVLGTSGRAADLADYLVHAGAAGLCVPSLAEALAWLGRVGPKSCVVVVADPPESNDSVLAACRAAWPAGGAAALAFVVIETGRRHRARRQKPDQVGLDGECLHSAVFLRSVAMAARPESGDDSVEFAADREPRAAAPEPARRVGADPLILVAEDNEINQQVLAKQLALLGYRAEMVGNGVEALASWRRGGHALLLTDLHMPVMDGYSLAAAVRTEEAGRARLPIIALTANALRDEALRCRQAGMDGYLTKPVRLAQLRAAIDPWLSPARRVPGGETSESPADATAPPADLDVLAALVGDDPQVMHDVLQAFSATTARSALELAQAQAGGAMQTVTDIAHRLKSAARAIGAARLGQICAELEEAAASGPRSAALATLVVAFDRELRAVHHFLDTR